MSDTLLDVALDYAQRGWRVVPIIPGQKRPAFNQWTKKATTDIDFVTAWWRAHPDHGIGIATGSGSGFFVIDIDVADPARNGEETLAGLEEQHGALPETVEVLTGSGGRHLYFAYPEGLELRNDASKRLGPGLDVRGEGGQVVAPPTLHPSGRRYEWELEHHPDTTEIAVAPDWLIELLTVRAEPVAPAAPSTNGDGERPGDIFNRQTTWEELLSADGWTYAHSSPDGEQHWTRPGKETRHGTSATVGYQGLDVLHVFTSSVAGLTPETTYSRFAYWTATRHGGDFSAAAQALEGLRRDAELAEWRALLDAQRTIAPLREVEVAGCELGQWEIDWAEFWAEDHTDVEWLVEPILAAGRQHAIHAGAKTGKSLMILEMCAAIATGRRTLSRLAGEPRSVLYVDYEMTPADLYDRLTTFGYDDRDDLSHLHYILLPSVAGLDTAEGGRIVLEAAKHYDATLVVVDTTARAVEGAENDADTFRAFYRNTGLGLKAANRTLVRLDHSGKDVTKGQRGSSAKNDDVDIVWQMIRKEDDSFELKATHRRVGWVPEKVAVVLTEHDDGHKSYRLAEGHLWAPGTADLARLLDEMGVPRDLGGRKVRELLKEKGQRAGNETLRDALKLRREMGREIPPDWGRST